MFYDLYLQIPRACDCVCSVNTMRSVNSQPPIPSLPRCQLSQDRHVPLMRASSEHPRIKLKDKNYSLDRCMYWIPFEHFWIGS